jgi:hypothetical protein
MATTIFRYATWMPPLLAVLAAAGADSHFQFVAPPRGCSSRRVADQHIDALNQSGGHRRDAMPILAMWWP